jgi:hypothetical protein
VRSGAKIILQTYELVEDVRTKEARMQKERKKERKKDFELSEDASIQFLPIQFIIIFSGFAAQRRL